MPRHKRDWKQYNKQLINRGNLNFWVTKKSLKFWKAKKKKKAGRPFTYSDEAIKAMLMVRFKYQLPLIIHNLLEYSVRISQNMAY